MNNIVCTQSQHRSDQLLDILITFSTNNCRGVFVMLA